MKSAATRLCRRLCLLSIDVIINQFAAKTNSPRLVEKSIPSNQPFLLSRAALYVDGPVSTDRKDAVIRCRACRQER